MDLKIERREYTNGARTITAWKGGSDAIRAVIEPGKPPVVNWGAMGSVPAQDAAQFAAALLEIASEAIRG